MTREEFLKDWGEKFWQYQIDIGYTRKSNQDEFERDIDELMNEPERKLIKFIILEYNKWLYEYGYCDSDIVDEFKYSDCELNFNNWYDTFIKEQP